MYHVLFFKTNSMKIQSIQNTICDISLSTSERFLCFSNSSSVSIIWHFFPQLSFPHRRHIIHIQIILNIPRIVSIHSCVLYTILLAKCPPPQGSFFALLFFIKKWRQRQRTASPTRIVVLERTYIFGSGSSHIVTLTIWLG